MRGSLRSSHYFVGASVCRVFFSHQLVVRSGCVLDPIFTNSNSHLQQAAAVGPQHPSRGSTTVFGKSVGEDGCRDVHVQALVFFCGPAESAVHFLAVCENKKTCVTKDKQEPVADAHECNILKTAHHRPC